MIKFFRKIRQNLLSQGKTGKYFKYAIGEIVLVVIGILIALQINNWNENRKEKIKTQTYLKLLLEDFKQESVKVNTYLEESKRIVSRYEAYEEKFSQSNMNFSEIATGLIDINIFSSNPVFGINTIEVLESTGDIRLISTEIRKKLIEFNRFQDNLKEVTKRNRDNFETQHNELGQLGWTPVISRLKQNTIIEPIWAKIKTDEYTFKRILAIESVYHVKYRQEKARVKSYDKLLKDMAYIEELINAELKE